MTIFQTHRTTDAGDIRVAARHASPFLTVSAAAQLAGQSDAAFRQALVKGRRPGFRVGKRWFVPEAGLVASLSGSAPAVDGDPRTVSEELTRHLPERLTFADLERFFGMRRPYLYDVLRASGIVQARSSEAVTTRDRLTDVLAGCHNGHRHAAATR